MAQKQYRAKIALKGGGMPIEVIVPANDTVQAKRVIESMYGQVSAWYSYPVLVR